MFISRNYVEVLWGINYDGGTLAIISKFFSSKVLEQREEKRGGEQKLNGSGQFRKARGEFRRGALN